jgi:hypothetical protein
MYALKQQFEAGKSFLKKYICPLLIKNTTRQQNKGEISW